MDFLNSFFSNPYVLAGTLTVLTAMPLLLLLSQHITDKLKWVVLGSVLCIAASVITILHSIAPYRYYFPSLPLVFLCSFNLVLLYRYAEKAKPRFYKQLQTLFIVLAIAAPFLQYAQLQYRELSWHPPCPIIDTKGLSINPIPPTFWEKVFNVPIPSKRSCVPRDEWERKYNNLEW